jgi:predicted metalloprotease
MRWQGNRRSDNVEDRRGTRGSGIGGQGGGLLRLLPLAFKYLGFKGTAVLIVLVGAYGLFTGNLGTLLGDLGLSGGASAPVATAPVRESREEKELKDFVSVVLADTEDTWSALFRQYGKTYREPTLVLFRDSVSSACGLGQAAMGPFYCPGDERLYIDLSFFEQLEKRHDAPGDFAQAYVIAHEVGHHVQNLLGISGKVQQARRQAGTAESNRLSVRLELQADCLAGVWAHHAHQARNLLEPGDVEEGLAAAAAVGDDTLQRQSRGTVSPDSFTHGSAGDRVKWFRMGLETGDINRCDTFAR